MPKLAQVGRSFLVNNRQIETIRLPQLEKVKEYFLEGSETLSEINIPHISKLQWLFSNNFHMISQIRKNEKAKKIDARQLAHLDKENEMTTSEVSWGGRIIERIYEMGKDLFKRNEDRSER